MTTPTPCRRKEHARCLVFYIAIVASFSTCLVFVKQSFDIQFPDAPASWTPNSVKRRTAEYDNLLLSVPFYVYEELAWVKTTLGNMTVEELSRTPGRSKHTDDFYFMKASLRHPMRTKDPSQAKLFVIPLLLNSVADRRFYSGRDQKLCVGLLCDRELLRRAANVLSHSEWFQAHPERHMVVQSHYLADRHFNIPKELKGLLYESNAITFEGQVPNNPERLRFPKLYVGNSCVEDPKHETVKTQDVALIASVNYEKLHYFQDRLNICNWIQNATEGDNNAAANSIRMGHCGRGDQCPALAQAKYGFHVRGDTLGSNRLLDTILSGTIPIFTLPEQYNVLPPWMDWKQLSVLIDMTAPDMNKRANFLRGLTNILEDTEGYKARHEAILRHRALFDWKTLYPFDTYMYMLQAELFPETRHVDHAASKYWPALILPPPLVHSMETSKVMN